MSYVKKEEKFQIAYKENRMSSPFVDRRRDTSRCSPSPVMRAAKRCSSVASSVLSSIITYLP